MHEKEIKNKEIRYISCIKINGVPILPPLVTHAKRKEIHKYKQQAIKFEKKLQREHELKQYLNLHYIPNLDDSTTQLVTNTLEHKLSFEEILSPSEDIKTLLTTSPSQKEVPSVIQKRASQLSCNLQASQYTNNEFTVLKSFGNCKSDVVLNDNVRRSMENSLLNEYSLESKADISDDDNQRPRLIRSNSYIIETPSPMLLEHLRKQSLSVDTNPENSVQLIHDSSIEHKYTKENHDASLLLEDNEVGSICQNLETNLNDSNSTDASKSESELRNLSYFSDHISNNNDDITVTNSQYHLKEFIDNNVPKILDNNLFENQNSKESEDCPSAHIGSSILRNIKEFSPDDSNISYLKDQFMSYNDDSLIKVLNNIPEKYSRQIIELLEKHKQEQSLKLNSHSNVNTSITSFNNEETSITNCSSEMLQGLESSVKLDQSFTNKILDTSTSYILPSNDVLSHDKVTISSERIAITSSENKELSSRSNINCNRELFPKHDEDLVLRLKEDHAASIIGARIKGYLVRRLLRTDRVQGLIQTIQDALICAMELHTENNDNIRESDVELHRRLIQQVSAACFEFHDVFFALSIAEQMSIIRLDRERQKEKSKRPLSRVSSGSKSTRSSRSITFSN